MRSTKFLVLIFTFLFGGISISFAQPTPSPVVHCVAVLANGNVTITWTQPADPNGFFDSYHIFSSSNSAGPFTDIDSIFTYGTTSYTTSSTNANAGQVYFYVETRSNPGVLTFAPATDTLSTIFLQVVNSGNVAALLSWNNISTPPPPTQFAWFKIYREYPVGNWVLLDSTQSLSYVDSLQVCHSQVNYRIEIGDAAGCTSVSNVAGTLFIDNVRPNVPVIDSITVDGTGQAQLGWQQSSSHDVTGYVIYEYIGGIWTPVDTVWGIGSNSYTYALSHADQGSESYVIAALDSCGNISAFSSQHNTLFLQKSFSPCSFNITLSWNAYINFPGGMGGYNVISSVNGGPWTIVATLPPGTTSWTQPALTQGSTYCYYVQAFNAANTMTVQSEQVCMTVNTIQEPTYNYLRVASVSSSNSVQLTGFVDPLAKVSAYRFYRADTVTGAWNAIGTSAAAPPSTVVSFTDNSVNTNKRSYCYWMTAVDSCGTDTALSNPACTIFLSAVSNEEITNTLMWNDYTQWSGVVQEYRIFRSIDGVVDPVPIAIVPFSNAGENVYVDDVSNLYPNIGKFSYMVEGFEGAGNIYGFADSTSSNWADVIQKPLVFVPNAFTPNGNGKNDVFMPSNGFVDVEDYEFAIFDRWGQKVFETNDKTAGWDGSGANGHRAAMDVYVWILTFKTASGQYIDMKGTVTLMR